MTADWIVGFTEGEGSFFIDAQKYNYKGVHHVNFHLGFSIAQKQRDILDKIQDYLGFGEVCKYGTQTGYQLRARGFQEAVKVQDFFLRNPLRSEQKRQAFSLWLKAFNLHHSRNHLNLQGIQELSKIRDQLHALSPRRKEFLNYAKITAFLKSGAPPKKQNWTKIEVELLKANFPQKSDKELASLVGHPLQSLISKRVRMGLTRMKKRKWTNEEFNYIKKMCHTMKDEEIAEAIHRTKCSVSWMRVQLGLKKDSAKNKKGRFEWSVKERKAT